MDACNNVMDNIQYPQGLIRLTTQNAVNQGWVGQQILRRIARPRVLIYSTILLGLSAAMVFSMVLREPLKVDVIRDRASLARIAPGGKLENVYRLQVMNATEQAQRYNVTVKGLQDIELAEGHVVEVESAQTRGVAVRVQIPYGTAGTGSHPIEFEITAQSGQGHVVEESVFLVPR